MDGLIYLRRLFGNVLPAKAGSFALALLHPRRASEQHGLVTKPLDGEPPSDWGTYATGAYDLGFFTRSRFPDRNLQNPVLNVHRNCYPPANRLCAFVQNKCTTSRRFPQEDAEQTATNRKRTP